MISTEEWSQRLWCASAATAESILFLGQQLLAAKDALPHGEFGRLFKGHKNPVPNPLPYSQSRANKLMSIARHPVINSEPVTNLPHSLRVLDRLARVMPVVLEEAISAGVVHARMTVKEAERLQKTRPTFSRESAYARIRESVRIEIQNAHAAGVDPRDVFDILTEVHAEVERATRLERRERAADARRDLAVRDAEPGGYRVFETPEQAAMHPGSPQVVAAVKSTYPDWYRGLTIASPGASSFRRSQVECALGLAEEGLLPNKRQQRAHHATMCALGVL